MNDTTTVQKPAGAMDTDGFDFGNGLGEAEPWKADRPGKELRGVLVELGDFTSSYTGETQMRLVIEDAQGVRWSWIPSAMPRRLIAERFMSGCIDIGKPIAVKYVDEVALKSGSGKLKRFIVLPELPVETQRARAKNSIAKFTKGSVFASEVASEPLSPEREAERQADIARTNLGDDFEDDPLPDGKK